MIFEPDYIAILLILLGIIYMGLLTLILAKYKFSIIGWCLLTLSIAIYLLVGVYMYGQGVYYDKYPMDKILIQTNFPNLFILSYAYIFIGLAVILGKKEK